MCVKHDSPKETIKMKKALQESDHKKLCSWFILYNSDHPAKGSLDQVSVNLALVVALALMIFKAANMLNN